MLLLYNFLLHLDERIEISSDEQAKERGDYLRLLLLYVINVNSI